jgi:hypothetical protein
LEQGGDYREKLTSLQTVSGPALINAPGFFVLTKYTKLLYCLWWHMADLTVFKELFKAKFDALEAKLISMASMLERDNDRQDEAIERLAERTTHLAETKRLTERVIKLEDQIETGRTELNDLHFKVKVTWAVGGAIITAILAVLIAVIQKWIGV